MKRAFGIICLVTLVGSLACFVLSFFYLEVIHYVLLGLSIPAIAFLVMAVHELIHACTVVLVKGELVAIHMIPFLYKEGRWSLSGRTMAVDFVERDGKKSAVIYGAAFVFTCLLEAAFILLYLFLRHDWALFCLIVNGCYFVSVMFKGGDLYNLFATLRRRDTEE